MNIKLDIGKKWLIYTAAFMMAMILSGCYTESYTKRAVKLVITEDSSASTGKLNGHSSTVIPVGGKIKLQALAAFDDNTFLDISNDIEWTSSDPEIVEVDHQGWVTALAHSQKIANLTDVENVEISVTKDGIKAVYPLKVTGAIISSIELMPHRIDLNKGNSAKLTAMGTYTDGSTRELSTNLDSLIWESTNYDMVSVINGIITAENVGAVGEIAQITVTRHVENEPTVVSSTADVFVLEKDLSRIELRPDPVTLPIGTTLPVSVFGIYTDGTEGDITNNGYIRWSEDDNDIAEVTNSGVVRAFKLGTTTITAALYEYEATSDVIVTNEKLENITITPSSEITLPLGFTHQFEAQGEFDDEIDRPVTDIVTWVSSDPLVATIDEEGLLTSNDVGLTYIHAEFDNGEEIVASDATAVVVSSAHLESIDLTPLSMDLPVNTYASIVAMGTYSDGMQHDLSSAVAWSSSPQGIVTIDRGAMRGIRKGNVDISVSYVNVNGDTITNNEDAKVSVLDASLMTIVVTHEAEVDIGSTTQLKATGIYGDSSDADLTHVVQWASDNPSVAKVNAAGVVEGISEGVANISASSEGITSSNKTKVSVSHRKLTNITITPYADASALSGSDTIIAGYDQLYIAKGVYNDGSAPDEPINADVSWEIKSDEEGVAYVNADGKVTAYKEGIVTLTAMAKVGDVVSAPFTIEVTEAELIDMSVSAEDTDIVMGGTTTFTAKGRFSDGSEQEPLNPVVWTSDDDTIAIVDKETGLVEGVAQGVARITATRAGLSASHDIKVRDAIIESIQLTPENIELNKGNSQRLTAMGVYTDGEIKELDTETDSLIWSSSNPHMAVVVDGVVTALNVGEVGEFAEISVAIADNHDVVSNTADVLVLDRARIGIELRPSTLSIVKGTEEQLTVMAIYTDGSEEDITSNPSIAWGQDDNSVAEVTNSGLIRAKDLGQTFITARLSSGSEEHISTSNVVVTDKSLENIVISPSDRITIQNGSMQQFEAKGEYDDESTDHDFASRVAWVSSNPQVATVDENGLLTTHAPGLSDIFATSEVNGAIIVSETTSVLVDSGRSLTSIELRLDAPRSRVTQSQESLDIELPVAESALVHAMGIYSDGTEDNISSMVTWSSDAQGIVTVANGLITGVQEGEVTITVSYNDNGVDINADKEIDVKVVEPNLTSIYVTATATVDINMTTQLKAIGVHADNSTSDYTNKVDWVSDDTTIATVEVNSGLVQGVSEGVAKITANYGEVSSSNNTEVSVGANKLEKITISPYVDSGAYSDSDTIIAGYDQLYIARGEYSDGSAPDDAINADVTWSIISNEEGIASVSAEGKVTTYKKGTVTLIAMAKVGDVESDPFTIDVTEAELVDIEVTSEESAIAMGERTTVTAKGIFSDGTELEPFSPVIWSSSNGNAVVDADTGEVTGVATGTATITATADMATVAKRAASAQGFISPSNTASRAMEGSVDIDILDKIVVGIEIRPHSYNGQPENEGYLINNLGSSQLYADYVFSDDTREPAPEDDLIWARYGGSYNVVVTDKGVIRSLNARHSSDGTVIVLSSAYPVSTTKTFITINLTMEGNLVDQTELGICEGAGSTYKDIPSNACISALRSDLESPDSMLVTAPLSRQMMEHYNLSADYYSDDEGMINDGVTGLMPDGNYAAHFRIIQSSTDNPITALCKKMNDIKLFGFDSWSVDYDIDYDNGILYFQPAYNLALFEGGRLVGHWPTTVSVSDLFIDQHYYSYVNNFSIGGGPAAQFLDGMKNELLILHWLPGGYIGCSVTPWQ